MLKENKQNLRIPEVVKPVKYVFLHFKYFLPRIKAMILAPKVITGALHPQNKGACDWGWQGALAYGCCNFVVVIETKTVQVYQVLDKHKATVIKVKWARENYHHDTGSPYLLRLASGDTNGSVIIWDVAQGREKIEFSDGNKPVQDMEWLPTQDASHDLLLVLHPPYSLILWNADTGTKLWKKSYTESLLSFALDPFSYRNIAFLGQECILFIDDFSITKTPSSNGKKFYISSPSASKGDTSSNTLERKSSATSSSRNLAKRMTQILVGESKERGEEENMGLNECIQLTYHKACRHHLILVYAREILILDLEINQTVGTIPMDRTGSPFLEVIPVQQRDVLFCLHENGSITCRVRRRNTMLSASLHEGVTGSFDDNSQGPTPDISYDLRCQSDSIRMTRHCKVTGVVCCPVTEKSLALLLSDSRVIFWDIHTVDFQESSANNTISPLYTPGNTQYSLVGSETSDRTLTANQNTPSLPVVSNLSPPKLALSDMIGQSQVLSPDTETASRGHGVFLKFLMTGLLNGLNSPITVIRMCPPLTTKNLKEYNPLLAVGSQIGKIQIVNLGSGHIEREYSLHTSIVRGIEWASLKSFISYSYPKPGVSNQVKNEIFLMDITSGKATPIRAHRDQESPIEMIRISHNKQYFLVAFKDKPLELWDLKALSMLRGMSHKLPFPTALEWSPSPSLKALKRKLQQQQQQQLQQQTEKEQVTSGPEHTEESLQGGIQEVPGGLSTSVSASSSSASINGTTESQTPILAKEHFIYTDSDGTLYHFAVEGSSFVDASKIPSESGMGSITWVAWKADFLIFGDADGQLCVWDLRAKTSRTNSTHRGWIKKIRFAPGRSHFKFLILYNDGVDVWDLKDGKPELVSSIKSPREIAKVLDAEWAGSDRPVLVTADGCVHMFDMSLKRTSCTIEERENEERTFEPYIVSQKIAFLCKLLLQHQRWTSEYQLKLTELGGGCEEEEEKVIKLVNQQVEYLDPDLVAYLPNCRFGTAERCLLTARLFGDESEVRFWTIALHYLREEKAQPLSKASNAMLNKQEDDIFRPQMSASKESNDLDLVASDDAAAWLLFKDQPLEKCYDFLCDNQSYKKYQLSRVALHDSKRPTHDHTRKCAENLMMLGQTDRAVQLLLETEPDTDLYYIDCLRACLVASIRSSGASQSTIKLVATNLIASGKLQEGVQLLCLIDKGLDACRYLQTYGAWEQAVWLAKSTLDFSDCCEVMKRWVDHLCSTQVNQKSTAVMVMLSLGQFYKVIEMLYGMRQFNRAACFIEAAIEFGVLEKTSETVSLIEAVFLEYARTLMNLGHKKSAEYYCQQAGDKGTQLLKEVEILFS